MPCDIVVGAQWGDEGKAKIIDFLTESATTVARFQGGANAGHTVIIGKEKYVFHLVPSGILHPGKVCLIGSGVVVDPWALFAEIDGIEARGIVTAGRVRICGSAHLILPYHKLLDLVYEEALGERKIGTTGKGIGPAYTMKAARRGIRAYDLVNGGYDESVRLQVREINFMMEHFYNSGLVSQPEQVPAWLEPFAVGGRLDAGRIIAACEELRPRLAPMVCDVALAIRDAIRRGETVLAEGAQGAGLDLNFGTYPFVTSSHPIAGGACVGLGLGPGQVRDVYGIYKAYITRVGSGPFPTELDDVTGERIRRIGAEFGATTGRPRRCGWFDGPFARYAAWINGITKAIITKLDVLDEFDEILFCTGYEKDGRAVEDFSPDLVFLEGVRPVYRSFPGWKKPTAGITAYGALPENARRYIDFLEEYLALPVSHVSVGPDRDETLARQ